VPSTQTLQQFEAQFANMTNKWYFYHVKHTRAGNYRIIFDALPVKPAAPEAKRAKCQNAESRIKSIQPAVLRWSQTAASVRKIEAQVCCCLVCALMRVWLNLSGLSASLFTRLIASFGSTPKQSCW